MAIHNLISIQSFDLPELAPYRTMRREMDHEKDRIFVAEGEKVVRRLLESPLEVVSIVLPAKWLESYTPLLTTRKETIQVFVAEKKLLEQLTGFSMYQGVLAVGRMPNPLSLPQVLDQTPRPWLLAAVDGVSSGENLGALVRNCAAFGVTVFIHGETSSSPYLRRAVRSSMGTVFRLPILPSSNLRHTLQNLRQREIRCVAAHPHTQQTYISQVNLQGDCCLIFGSEGHGISPEILEVCDVAAAIPMSPTVDSLNVTSAGAVFLYEAARQRGTM